MALVRIGSDNIDEIDVKLGNIPLRWKITYPTGEPDLVLFVYDPKYFGGIKRRPKEREVPSV